MMEPDMAHKMNI